MRSLFAALIGAVPGTMNLVPHLGHEADESAQQVLESPQVGEAAVNEHRRDKEGGATAAVQSAQAHDSPRDLLNLRSVSKKYGNVEALKDLNLTVETGETVAILGPSGAGKSTTLKVIAGLETADSGEVYLHGRLVNHLEPKDRNLAMVFEQYALYPQATVFENLASPLYPLKMDKQAIAERVNQFATILGIHRLLDRKPAQLSGGQKQRVALGRALVKPAALYLMDEPIAHLDAKLRHQMRAEFKHLQQSLRISMVYVTHDWQEALSLGDHIAVLNKGKVEQYGTKDDVFHYPRNTFVAQMVGDPPLNLIKGTIAPDAGSSLFRTEGASLPLGQAMVPGNVTLGIRPFKLDIASSSDRNPVRAEVYASERHGMDTVVTLVMDGTALKMKCAGRRAFRIGESIPLQFDLAGACVFSEQGQLITVMGRADG